MDHPKPWLRYLDADDLDSKEIKFKGFDVKNVAGESLGELNGFIVDTRTGDPYYLVVDARGWFKTKHYLVPIGHAQFDPARSGIVADLTKEQIHKFPGFDADEFARWNDEDVDRFNRETIDVCCTDAVVMNDPSQRWSAAHYRRPDWWDNSYYRPERAGEAGMPAATWGREMTQPEREPAMAHDRDRKR